jgi:hypothetical protein
LRYWCRPRWVSMVWVAANFAQGGVASLDPPPEMIERQPYLPRFMAGGPGNPLGARHSISAARCTEYTAQTNRKRLAVRCPGASDSQMAKLWICMSACRSGQRSSFGTGRNIGRCCHRNADREQLGAMRVDLFEQRD